jgi:hypothetical protein
MRSLRNCGQPQVAWLGASLSKIEDEFEDEYEHERRL